MSKKSKAVFFQEDALPLVDRHSRVFLAGVQGFAGVDARQVHAGMTITWMF
jgi:hypothetical protein